MNKYFTNRVYVDANIIIDDFFYKENKKEANRDSYSALQFLFGNNRFECYLGSFSLILFIKTLKSYKVKENIIIEHIKTLLKKFQIVEFSQKDIENSFENLSDCKETEDHFQYALCKKMRCFYFVTKNKNHFKDYKNIEIIVPKKIREIQ